MKVDENSSLFNPLIARMIFFLRRNNLLEKNEKCNLGTYFDKMRFAVVFSSRSESLNFTFFSALVNSLSNYF